MSVIVATSLGRFRKVADLETVFTDRWVFECPGCGTWAYLDDDQWHGRISVDHSGETSPTTGAVCDYHETNDYFTALEGDEPR